MAILRVNIALIDDLYLEQQQLTKTFVADDPSGELHLTELVQQRPPWEVEIFQRQLRKKKKIIISDWRFAYKFSPLEIEYRFLELLTDAGFEVYYWQESLKHQGLQERFRNTYQEWQEHAIPPEGFLPASREEVLNFLGQCNENLSGILVLDHAGFQVLSQQIARQLEVIPSPWDDFDALPLQEWQEGFLNLREIGIFTADILQKILAASPHSRKGLLLPLFLEDNEVEVFLQATAQCAEFSTFLLEVPIIDFQLWKVTEPLLETLSTSAPQQLYFLHYTPCRNAEAREGLKNICEQDRVLRLSIGIFDSQIYLEDIFSDKEEYRLEKFSSAQSSLGVNEIVVITKFKYLKELRLGGARNTVHAFPDSLPDSLEVLEISTLFPFENFHIDGEKKRNSYLKRFESFLKTSSKLKKLKLIVDSEKIGGFSKKFHKYSFHLQQLEYLHTNIVIDPLSLPNKSKICYLHSKYNVDEPSGPSYMESLFSEDQLCKTFKDFHSLEFLNLPRLFSETWGCREILFHTFSLRFEHFKKMRYLKFYKDTPFLLKVEINKLPGLEGIEHNSDYCISNYEGIKYLAYSFKKSSDFKMAAAHILSSAFDELIVTRNVRAFLEAIPEHNFHWPQIRLILEKQCLGRDEENIQFIKLLPGIADFTLSQKCKYSLGVEFYLHEKNAHSARREEVQLDYTNIFDLEAPLQDQLATQSIVASTQQRNFYARHYRDKILKEPIPQQLKRNNGVLAATSNSSLTSQIQRIMGSNSEFAATSGRNQSSSIEPDLNTESSELNSRGTIEIYHGENPVPISSVRKEIFDKIENGQLKRDTSLKAIIPYPNLTLFPQKGFRDFYLQEFSKDPSLYFAINEIDSVEKMPLSGLTPYDRLTHMAVTPKTHVYYDCNKQQFLVEPSSETRESYFVFYIFRANGFSPSSQVFSCHNDSNDLLRQHLVSFAQQMNSPLQEILTHLENPLSTAADKIRHITVYCQKFSEGALLEDSNLKNKLISLNLSSYYKLCLLTLNQKGVCRHRAQVFLWLCQLYQIPAHYNENQVHATTESFNDGRWTSHELGGGAARINVRNHPEINRLIRDSKQLKLPVPEATKPVPSKYFVSLHVNSEKEFFAHLTHSKNPLFRFNSQEQLSTILHSLRKEWQHKRIIYIHSKQHLEELFQTAVVTATGQLQLVRGPLQESANTAELVSVINWAGFSTGEIAIYKTVVDERPFLNAFAMHPEATVVGLYPQGRNIDDSFRSRCTGIEYDLAPSATELPTFSEKSVQEIQLYGDVFWKKHLLGSIIPQGNHFEYQAGNLARAINNSYAIRLINPPDCEDYHEFKRILNRQHWFLENNEIIEVIEPLQEEKRDFPLQLTELQLFRVADENISQYAHLILNPVTLRKLFASYTEKEHLLFQEEGMIKHYDQNKALVLTAPLTSGQWQQVIDQLRDYNQQQQTLGRPKLSTKIVCPESIALPESFNTTRLAVQNVTLEPKIFCCDDPLFKAEQMSEEIANSLVIPVNLFTRSTDLLERSEVSTEDEGICFKHFFADLFEKLRAGKTIILAGELPLRVYYQLESLLCAYPYYYANGELIYPHGKLLLVTPTVSEASSALAKVLTSSAEFACDYADYLKLAQQQGVVFSPEGGDKIIEFLDVAEKIFAAKGFPHFFKSYHRFKNLLKFSKSTLHDNPIKAFFHEDLPRDSELYGLLNVIAKIYFSPRAKNKSRLEKMQRPIERHNQWFNLNCLTLNAIEELLGEPLRNFPQLLDDNWNIKPVLFTKLKSLENSPVTVAAKQYRQTSYYQKLLQLLQSPDNPIITIKGPAGSSKTHFSKQINRYLASARCFYSSKAIEQWLEAGKQEGDRLCILTLDEFNLQDPGTWDFLYSLLLNHSEICYKGKLYPASKSLRVLFLGNPESYQGRFFHNISRDGLCQYMKPMTTHELYEIFILPYLVVADELKQAIARIFIHEFKALQQEFPQLEFSGRDLQQLTLRFELLQEKLPQEKAEHVALIACYEQWMGLWHDQSRAEAFFSRCAQQLNLPPYMKINCRYSENIGHYLVSPSRHALLARLDQDLEIANRAMLRRITHFDKRATLLQGPPGIGKSLLVWEFLKGKGYKPWQWGDPEPLVNEWSMTRIDTGNRHAEELLLKAYRFGMKVVLEEVNLDPRLESLLNDLITGKSTEADKPLKPGFQVFCTQNAASAHVTDRFANSTALLNRARIENCFPYPKVDLHFHAEKRNLEASTAIEVVDEYFREKQYRDLNDRDFLNKCDELALIENGTLRRTLC